MANEQITFDKLPQPVAYLTKQMEQIRQMVAALQPSTSSGNHHLLKLTKPVKSYDRQSLLFTHLPVKD